MTPSFFSFSFLRIWKISTVVLDVTEDQIRTAKEIFPSLFINYGRVLPEVVIARCIFENNFDSGIVSRSLDRKVKMVMG